MGKTRISRCTPFLKNGWVCCSNSYQSEGIIWVHVWSSSIASGGAGGRVPPQQKICQKSGKRGKKSGKRGKTGKKRQKSGRFFYFAPSDREGWLHHWSDLKLIVFYVFHHGCLSCQEVWLKLKLRFSRKPFEDYIVSKFKLNNCWNRPEMKPTGAEPGVQPKVGEFTKCPQKISNLVHPKQISVV